MTERKVLGIIGCQVLEDEIVHVISSDDEVTNVVIIMDSEAKALSEKIRDKAPKKRIAVMPSNEARANIFEDGLNVIVKILPIALHQVGSDLREHVVSEIERMERFCDAALIFYGLCGQSFRNIDGITSKFRIPVLILRDSEHRVVDDCVGTVLGGTDEYLDFLRRDRGGYTLNSMWASNWRHFMKETQIISDENNIEEAKMVFECMGYTSVVKLDTGLADHDTYDKAINDFAETFNLNVVCVNCTLTVVENSYLEAKKAAIEKVIPEKRKTPTPALRA